MFVSPREEILFWLCFSVWHTEVPTQRRDLKEESWDNREMDTTSFCEILRPSPCLGSPITPRILLSRCSQQSLSPGKRLKTSVQEAFLPSLPSTLIPALHQIHCVLIHSLLKVAIFRPGVCWEMFKSQFSWQEMEEQTWHVAFANFWY